MGACGYKSQIKSMMERRTAHNQPKNSSCGGGQAVTRPPVLGGEDFWRNCIEDAVHDLDEVKSECGTCINFFLTLLQNV